MLSADMFVGLVACGLACFFLGSAIGNWEASFRLRKSSWIEQYYGRGVARFVMGLVGILCCVIGVYLLFGTSLKKSSFWLVPQTKSTLSSSY
jgi:hypothetical protein